MLAYAVASAKYINLLMLGCHGAEDVFMIFFIIIIK